MATGITEPLEFSFLFVAPALFAVQVVLAGSAYMIAHILNIAVGPDLFRRPSGLFPVWYPSGKRKDQLDENYSVESFISCCITFIFKFMIRKFNFKTPGREDDVETKLYTKAGRNARKRGAEDRRRGSRAEDPVSEAITRGLGGKKNISDVDCCATRLRCTVKDASLVNDGVLKATGASGVVHKGNGVQVIYGPNVTVINQIWKIIWNGAGHTGGGGRETPEILEEEKIRKIQRKK